MDTNQLYKITKISHLDTALAKAAPDVHSYWKSIDNSPNVDYWLVGYLRNGLPEVGESLVVDRIIRNGVTMEGIFITSPSDSIENIASDFDNPIIVLQTKNSVYSIEKYEP